MAAALTQRALAAKSGVHEISISRIERGHMNPSSRNLRRIAHALGIPVHDIALPTDPSPTVARSDLQAPPYTRVVWKRLDTS